MARLGEQKLEYVLKFRVLTLNNEAKYEALIQGIEFVREIGAKR